jgi:hypothetical protein
MRYILLVRSRGTQVEIHDPVLPISLADRCKAAQQADDSRQRRALEIVAPADRKTRHDIARARIYMFWTASIASTSSSVGRVRGWPSCSAMRRRAESASRPPQSVPPMPPAGERAEQKGSALIDDREADNGGTTDRCRSRVLRRRHRG